jgi:hypothetical protein
LLWPSTELFHIRTVLSSEALAMSVPSLLIAISFIAPLCPVNLKGRICGLKFHTKMIPSSLPVTLCFMFGLNSADVIVPVLPLKDR